MSVKGKYLFVAALAAVVFAGGISHAYGKAPTPVEKHGFLRVEGNKVVDQHGEPVQLRGMSFFWSQWMGQFYNRRVVDWLVDDWKVTLVRAAMGVKHDDTQSGFMYDSRERNKVRTVVDAAVRRGIYVIIDWHDHHGEDHVDAAQRFFEDMARTYGHLPNVIYEIYNEPLQVSWSEVVKPYSERIVAAIRAIDPNNLIILGTPFWCQRVDEAADDPLDAVNVVYSLHFYAASHKDDIRARASYALEKGVPLFVSEWGMTLASGDGFVDTTETRRWLEFIDEHKLSWANWSIADKSETSAALVPGANRAGKWKYDDLTQSGRFVRGVLRSYAGYEENLTPRQEREPRMRLQAR